MLGHFLNENDTYCEKKEFYDVDGTFNNFKLFDHLEYLNKLVKSCSLGNKLFLNPKTIETDTYKNIFLSSLRIVTILL